MTQKLKKRLFTAIIIFLGLTLVGTAGYMVIEGYSLLNAVYMTIITVSTVGYGIPKPLSDAGRVFTIGLIMINVVFIGYSVTLISSFFLDADFIKLYRTRKMMQKISALSNHVIVCGYGRTGREAVAILKKNHIPVVVIEKDEAALKNLLEDNHELYIAKDANANEAMLEAGIHNAKALITTLPADADNVFVTLTASELKPGLLIVSRATHSSSVPKLKRAGAANVIMPYKIGGAHMASLVVNPDVKEFIDVIAGHTGFNAHVEELDLQHVGRSFIGKSVKDTGLHTQTGVNIIGLKKGDQYMINPEDDVVCAAGDKLLVLGSPAQFEKLRAHLQQR